jgi:hypothetical protein
MPYLLVVKNGRCLILIKFEKFAVDRAASEFRLPTSVLGHKADVLKASPDVLLLGKMRRTSQALRAHRVITTDDSDSTTTTAGAGRATGSTGNARTVTASPRPTNACDWSVDLL